MILRCFMGFSAAEKLLARAVSKSKYCAQASVCRVALRSKRDIIAVTAFLPFFLILVKACVQNGML